MERWHPGQHVGSMHGRCRVHKAEVLRLRGDCGAAEKEILLACDELRPYLRRELGWPLTELGRIRLRLGDLDGAEEAFLAAYEAGWDPQPGLALVRLARGDIVMAAASIRDALDCPLDIPSKEWPPNTQLRRAPLLEADVEISIAAGDLARAQVAAAELGRIATVFESRSLAASAAMANARVELASGDAAAAREDAAAALQGWNEVGAPYEAAQSRIALGLAHRALGNEQQAQVEFGAAKASFERIGAKQEAARAEQFKNQARPPRIASSASAQATREAGAGLPVENAFLREGDYWSVGFEGQIVRLRDMKGLRYLTRLLAYPGREFHVLDLAAMEAKDRQALIRAEEPGLSLTVEGGAGDLLDARAKEAYRRRLVEIEDDIEEARRLADTERAARAEQERDFLVRELARAVGLGGRSRRAGSPSERARVSVTRAIRQALARLQEHSPALGAHLDVAIRTGTYCSYCPDPSTPRRWRL
jgi:hypothetical protein